MSAGSVLPSDHFDKGLFRQLASLPQDLRRELTEALLWSLPRDDIIAINTSISLRLQKDIIASLPPELGVIVLSKLDLEDILTCSLVSKTWNRVCNEQSLWAELCRIHAPPIHPRATTWPDLAVHQMLLNPANRPKTPTTPFGDEAEFEASEDVNMDERGAGPGPGSLAALEGYGNFVSGSTPASVRFRQRRSGVRDTVWERSGAGLPTHAHPLTPTVTSGSSSGPRFGNLLEPTFQPIDTPLTSNLDFSIPSSLPIPSVLPQVNHKHLYIVHRKLFKRLRGGYEADELPDTASFRMRKEVNSSISPRSIDAISSIENGGLPGHSEAIYCLQLIARPMKITIDYACPDCHRPPPGPFDVFMNLPRPPPRHSDHLERTTSPTIISGRDWLLSGSRDHSLRLWQLSAPSPKVVKVFHSGHSGSILSLHVIAIPKSPSTSPNTSPHHRRRSSRRSIEDTKLVAISGGSDGRICLWDIEEGDGTPEQVNNEHTDAVMFVRADERHVVSCSKDRRIRVFDIHTLKEKLVIGNSGEFRHKGSINGVALSREYIISAAADKFIRVWDIQSGTLLAGIEASSRGLSSIDFELPGPNSIWRPSHPGSILKGTIVVGSSDMTIKTFHLVSHSYSALSIVDALDIVPPFRNMTFHEMLFDEDEVTMAPDGSTEQDPELRIEPSVQCWAGCICSVATARADNVRCGKCFNKGHTDLVRSLQFGEQVIYSGSYDSTVKVWDRATGRLLADLPPSHGGRVFAVAGDRMRIISSGLDSRLTIWDLSEGLDTAFVEP